MNVTKQLICILAAGATLGIAAPAFADSGRDRGHDSYRGESRHYDRGAYQFQNRAYDRRHFVAVRRPVFVPRPVYYAPPPPVYYAPPPPVYYAQPAPAVYGIGPAAIIGAAIGGLIDYHDYRR